MTSNPPTDRITLSEKTRNFLAITFYPPRRGKRLQFIPMCQPFLERLPNREFLTAPTRRA